MNLSVGIVGLPNVGKSTLFNALLKKQQALAANYPFATIEPNVGVVPVPDDRLQKLAEITKEEEKMGSLPPIKPATVEFLDIAGLVKGASEGAGLGNKFLSHIREVSIIAHVVRAFSDENVIREGSTDVKSDYQTIETELMIADLQTVQTVQSRIKRNTDPNEKSAVEKLFKALNEGIPARDVQLSDEEKAFANQWFLLSSKPEIIVLNVDEQEIAQNKAEQYAELLGIPKENFVQISAKIEAELAELSNDEQKIYLADLGIKESGLERLIKKAYETLGLISFLTAGEKEVRAWTIKKGMNAQNAAGVIHTDFIKNFIKAEVVSFEDFVGEGPARHASQPRLQSPEIGGQVAGVAGRGWKKARELGKARMEGKDYIVKDGDVIEFKIGK